MLLEHRGKRPFIHETAYVAPSATICGDVTIGEDSRVLFGAVIVSEGGPVNIGSRCIIMENAVVRGTPGHPTNVGNNVIVGPRAYLSGCIVKTVLPCGSVVPIGWVAVGDPAEILPPDEHERIWAVQEPLDFPGTVFGLGRGPAETIMPELTRRYVRALGLHKDDRILDG